MCGDDGPMSAKTQVAVIAGNLELAEMIQNYKPEDIGKCGGCWRWKCIFYVCGSFINRETISVQ